MKQHYLLMANTFKTDLICNIVQELGKKSQGSSGMLIDIVRILGITNRYLAAGGVKGDSHFPWHSLSKSFKNKART